MLPTTTGTAEKVCTSVPEVVLVGTPCAPGRMPALRHDGDFLLPAAALAHLAVEARGSLRVRRGLTGWQQADVGGNWTDLAPLSIGEVLWYHLAAGWRLTESDDGSAATVSIGGADRRTALAEVLPTQRVAARSTLTVVHPDRRSA